MSSEPINEPQRFWKDVFREHFGLIATIGTFLFVTLQLLVISRGNIPTANFLVAHSDKIPLLIGLFLPFFPILLVLFILILLKVALLRVGSDSLIAFQALVATGLFTLTLSEKLMTWKMLAFTLIISYAILDFPTPLKFRNMGLAKYLGISVRKSNNGVFRANVILGPGVLLTFLILVALNSSRISTFPLECITQIDGTKTIASVLSVDSKYTYILALKGSTPMVLNSSEVATRTVSINFGTLNCDKLKPSK